MTTTISAVQFRELLKQANNNLKKVRLPETPEELAGQEADYKAWEAERDRILQALGGSSDSGSTTQAPPDQAEAKQDQAAAGAQGTGTGSSGCTTGCTCGKLKPKPAGSGAGWALVGLVLAMTCFTLYVFWAYKQVGVS